MAESVFENIDPDLNALISGNDTCEYFTLNEYINSCFQNSRIKNFKFNLINYNIRSYNANHSTFEAILETLPELPKFICLTETWNKVNCLDLCKLSGFLGYHVYRPGLRRGGGVSVFCVEEIESIQIETHSVVYNHFESCVTKVTLDGPKYMLIFAIYRPPTESVEEFIETLNTYFNDPIFQGAETVIVCGDININLLDCESPTVNAFISFMNSYFYIPTITKATRFPNDLSNNPSNLDHIWINKITPYKAGILNIDFTDHLPTFFHFSLPAKNLEQNKKIKISLRPYSQQNFDLLVSKIASTNWNEIVGSGDSNIVTEIFIDKLNELYRKCFPLKIKYLSKKRIEKPWLTDNLMHLTRLKSEYYKYYKLGIISKQTNNRFKNMVSKKIEKSKTMFYLETFNTCKNNLKKTWRTIKELMGTSYNKSEVRELVINGTSYKNELDIANEFNNFFSKIASKLVNELPPTTTSPLSWMPPSPPSNFRLYPITESECSKLIKNLKNSGSNIDHMPARIFKSVSAYIISPLVKIMNKSFEDGIYPNCLKIGRIITIFKSGNPTDPSNYRPISTLPYLSKLFESFICNRFLNYFDKFNILTPLQFGFRKGRSTCDAITELTESIYDSLNKKSIHLSVLVDFKKAFDTISHGILINKLYCYGIRGYPLNLIESYLNERKQYVCIGSKVSQTKEVCAGIPQGACLGPLLFLVYINDLPNVSPELQSLIFADDTTLSMNNKKFFSLIQKVNHELIKVKIWTVANKLTINVAKTNVIVFSKLNFPQVLNFPIKIENEIVNMVPICKFLGVFIDEKLSFASHIKYITSKIARNTGILYKIKNHLPLQARLNYYYSFIYPYLTYNVISWGGTYNSHLSNLITQQKRIVRAIADAPFLEHTTPIFLRLKLLKFPDVYKFHVALHMYENHGKYRRTHNVNTRFRNFSLPSFNRLTICQHAISYQGPTIWNELPNALKEISSKNVFKTHLKLFFLNQYV